MTPPPVSPLAPLPAPLPPASALERGCMWVPVLGWAIASHLETRRRRPLAEHVARQLAGRPPTPRDAWGEDPRRIDAAEVICQAIAREFGWPNAHYLPDDPLELLMWSDEPDVMVLGMVLEMEKRFGVEVPPHWEFWKLSLGDFVDRVLRLPPARRENSSDGSTVHTS